MARKRNNRLLIGFLIGVFALSFLWVSQNLITKNQNDSQIQDTSLTSNPSTSDNATDPGQLVNLNNQQYSIYIYKVSAPENINLIPNFSQKLLANKIFEQQNCQAMINGGFYDTSDNPLGLFINNGQVMQKSSPQNAFINGYVYKDAAKQIHISRTQPSSSAEFAFQTGPIVTPNTKLAIKNDELDRRMVLIEGLNNEIYFVTLITAENRLSGPLLADVPQLLGKLDLKIKTAINLDGGSASAIIAPGFSFSEFTNVGSFLCEMTS